MNSFAVFGFSVLIASVFIFTKSAGVTHRIYAKDMFLDGPELGLKCGSLPLRSLSYGKSASWRVRTRKNKVTVSTCLVIRHMKDGREFKELFVALNSSAPPDDKYIYRRGRKAGGKIYYSVTGKAVFLQNKERGDQELCVKSWKRRTD